MMHDDDDFDVFEGDSDDDRMNSDSSEDDLGIYCNIPKAKNEDYLEETVPLYDNQTFKEHFRVSREIVENIVGRYEGSDQYKHQSGQYGKLSALSQVLIFLWFIGHQTASFRDVADRFDISLSSLHRIVKRLAVFISNLSPQVITWPAEDEKVHIEQHFRESGFPGVIGAIDGCHIENDKPANDPDSYINRKGHYSIQMQAVCDHRRKILDVFLGYPGSVHDSRVFRNSPLGNNLEEKCGQYFLLGDSGYPLKRNLLTPFRDRGQLNEHQVNYNVSLARSRYVIEHTFGILKQKFRQLYHVKLRDIELIAHLIRAACVLHNISINEGFVFNEDVGVNVIPQVQFHPEDEEDLNDDRDAAMIRENIALRL